MNGGKLRSNLNQMIHRRYVLVENLDAQSILRGLGSTSTARLLPGLGIPTERPPLEAVTDVFKTHPEVLFAKLKNDLRNERLLAFKSLIFGILHLESAQRLVYKILPNAYVAPVTELIGLSYNSYVLNKYFVDIERVLMSPNSNELKLNLLMEVNSKYSTRDELLVAFARMMSQSTEWSRLHSTAKELSNANTGADNFTERMTKAEIKARTMGDLPRFEDISIVDRVASAAVPVAGISYAIFADHPWLGQAANYLKSLFGF